MSPNPHSRIAGSPATAARTGRSTAIMALVVLATLGARATRADDPPGGPLISARYGLTVTLPEGWTPVVREREDTVFAALIDRGDPERPGVVACELGLAPESLDAYRTRIDGNARRAGARGGTLVRNEVVTVAAPEGGPAQRLETVKEFRRGPDEVWIERSVRLIAHRQLYTFLINTDEQSYARAEPRFDALIAAARFTPPDTGTDRDPAPAAAARNRWIQREYRFALDLPEGWSPALAPSEVALLYATGPPHEVWSDNGLVIARPHAAPEVDLAELARTLPDELKRLEPGCEVLRCEVIAQGKTPALETVVRTRRGPFTMTVLERRFRGARLDYEVKFTLESARFDALEPSLRKCLESFEELPGPAPRAGKSASRHRRPPHHTPVPLDPYDHFRSDTDNSPRQTVTRGETKAVRHPIQSKT